jgi:3-oxoacyl-(acyl-carrier-protein) synthase
MSSTSVSSIPPGPQASGRVVVTGVGAVTPLGTGVDTFWPKVVAGTNGVRRISLIDPEPYTTQVAAEVPDFEVGDWLDKKDARRMDRFLHFAVASATMALQDSGKTNLESLSAPELVVLASCTRTPNSSTTENPIVSPLSSFPI